MTNLIDHLEGELGSIQEGWKLDPDGNCMPFQIARFRGGLGSSTSSYVTVGLSAHTLRSEGSSVEFRQELLVLASDQFKPDPIVSILWQIGTAAIQSNRALVRGDVVGPHGSIADSKMEAFYVAQPVYFPDAFARFEDTDGVIVVAWLIPITAQEARFVSSEGGDAFENLLVGADPDLTTFARPGVVPA